MAAIDAGKPVYCEKPLTLNYADTARLVRYAQEKGVPLLSAYYRRAMPYFLKIQEILQSGAIGPVRCVQIFQSAAHGTKGPSENRDVTGICARRFPAGGCSRRGLPHAGYSGFSSEPSFPRRPSAQSFGTTPADERSAPACALTAAPGSALWFLTANYEESFRIFGNKGPSARGASFIPIDLTPKRAQPRSSPNARACPQPLIQSVEDQLRAAAAPVRRAKTAAHRLGDGQILGTL